MAARRSAEFLLVAILLTTLFLLYRQSLAYPMVFDDIPSIVYNRAIRYWGHWSTFFGTLNQRDRLLSNLSYAWDYSIDGLKLSVFRCTNITLHLCNTLLFWLLARRLYPGRYALLAASVLLFALHPINVEEVVYLTTRSVLLAEFFLLSALFAMLTRLYVLVLPLFACAVLAKENGAVLPLLLLLLLPWLERGKKPLLAFVAAAALVSAAAVVRKWNYLSAAYGGFFRYQGDVEPSGFFEFLRMQLSVWPKFLKLLLAGGFSLDHSLGGIPSWSQASVWGTVLALALFSVSALRFWKRQNPAAFGWLWMLVALLPTNSVFPVIDPYSERHLYFALPGFCLVAGGLLERISRGKLRFALPALCALAVFLAFSTDQRIKIWRTNSSLWLDAVEKSPRKLRVRYNAALALQNEGARYADAAKILGEWYPTADWPKLSYDDLWDSSVLLYANALRAKNLGSIFGDGPEAAYWLRYFRLYGAAYGPGWEKDYREAMKGIPASYLYVKRGKDMFYYIHILELLRAQKLELAGKHEEARRAIEKVFSAFDEDALPYWRLRDFLAGLYENEGRYPEAARQYAMLLNKYKIFKIYSVPHFMRLAELYKKMGDWARAKDSYGEILLHKNDHIEARKGYIEALRQLGKNEEVEIQERELRYYNQVVIPPDSPQEMIHP